jgi:pheromone shutdown-related protein TraB
MTTKDNNNMVHRFQSGEKEIILIGTAHVSRESADLVAETIMAERPDTVSLELCAPRYQSMIKKDHWLDMNIIKVIKEKKAFLLLANLLMASFQKRLAKKMDIRPGEEMIQAARAAEAIGAEIHLADREIRVTLSRAWRVMGAWEKVKLLFQLLMSAGDVDEISEADIEKLKQEDVLQSILADVEKSHPVLRKILIDERDQYLTAKIKAAPGKKIVAVVGAGHAPGIASYWDSDIDLPALEVLPPKSSFAGVLKWGLPLIIFLMFGVGFFFGGAQAGTDMIKWWLLANGVLAGIGAVIAMAHPATIIAAILAAPLTSLNPMIAAGWVSGLVEAFFRKPKVKDFEALSEDILSLKGFWRNPITRILLVVVLTNLGSSLGTMVAFPLILKIVVQGG